MIPQYSATVVLASTIHQPLPYCTFTANESEARLIVNQHEALVTMGEGKKWTK